MSRPTAYHLLPIAEKRKLAISNARESSVSCPACDMQVMPADLLRHMDERCEGVRVPGGAAKWVVWSEVEKLGVAAGSLHYWVQQGRVRRRGERIDYQYLLRDIVLILASRRARQRRDFEASKSEELETEATK